MGYGWGVRHFESQSGYYIKEAKQLITINSQGIRVPNDKKITNMI